MAYGLARRKTASDVLNMLRWSGRDWRRYTVVLADRSSPSGESMLPLSEVEGVDKSYLYTRGGAIPMHRVLRILDSRGRVIWDKESPWVKPQEIIG